MGQTPSKPLEVKTFIPQTPVEFSSSLLAQLENSTESDYTRSQYAESYIQQRVNEELKKLEQKAVEDLDKSLSKSLKTEDDTKLKSSTIANDKLDLILSNLQKINDTKPKIDDKLVKSQTDVINCLKDNKGKPLNCWNEFEIFKELINKL